jgi:pentapeptide repeat protein
MTTAYFAGRTPAQIVAPYTGTKHIYGSELLDGSTIQNASYEHCTFANISFKDVTIQDGRFLNCVFMACYFRKAQLRTSSFSASRFIDCEFPDTSFSACDFRYARFIGCYVDYREIEHSLPQEPNLRHALAHNLAREAAKLGDAVQAQAYRLAQLSAREIDLWGAYRGTSKWYREHYDLQARVRALFQLLGSYLNRLLFGYGERPAVLLRNYALAAFIVFPAIFMTIPNAISNPVSAGQITFWNALDFSVHNATAGAIDTPVVANTLFARILAGAESLLAAIWGSLFASYLFRWSLHR